MEYTYWSVPAIHSSKGCYKSTHPETSTLWFTCACRWEKRKKITQILLEILT